ncbi:MAG: hypothetical protein R6U20_11595, partial [Longimonas sp.]|uniref:hypothetical protein n=1 Tax=Longimonas sp. TaxID=2039626 RepID=UPI0039762B67
KILCHHMNIDIHEVIKAASTKPFGLLNGAVDKRIYESMDHIVNNDEREAVQQLLQAVVA